ncbi:MAG: STAS domain-containing protein, partial [Alicyclobacillus sp.]|nr:STAS domain-containing protein [Alicyclobacillus sp.]
YILIIDDLTEMLAMREAMFRNEKFALIGQFAAGIAHEIRNPLTAVKGFIQLLQEASPHRYLDVASAELDRAIAILQDLLQVSKPDSDTEPYQPVSLCAELESTLYLFQNYMYRVAVERDFRDTEIKILGKRNQLKKALFNLLKNAFEAIPDVGKVTLRHHREDGDLCLVIHDTGEGMPPESLAMLGTPFFTTKDDGTGMGLAQVFAVIYQHEGTIRVESQPGAGTTISMRFPLLADKPVGGTNLDLVFKEGQTFEDFFQANLDAFHGALQQSAVNTFRYIREQGLDPLPLLAIADQIVPLVMQGNRLELVNLGKTLGRNTAKNDYPIALIFEITESFKHCLWDMLYRYYQHVPIDAQGVFELERRVNNQMDHYLTHYLTNYIDYKNEVLRSHREALDELSVPVIPLSSTRGVLPLVGIIDTFRAKKIQEKTLVQVSQLRLQHIIIDVSGVVFMDTAVVTHLVRLIDGIHLLGCRATITGIRPEIANTMIGLGISLEGKVETKATLQQALETLLC